MPESENKLLARRLLEEVVNAAAVDRLAEFFDPECSSAGAMHQGLDAFREHLLAYHRCYPDLRVTVDGQVAEGETVVTWWTMRGTHTGEWGGVSPTHKPVVLRGVNIQRIRNGRIVEHWGAANALEVLLELGIVRWADIANDNSTHAFPPTPSGSA